MNPSGNIQTIGAAKLTPYGSVSSLSQNSTGPNLKSKLSTVEVR